MEVGAEETDPEERCLLGDRWQCLLDDIGGLVLALQYLLAVGNSGNLCSEAAYVEVRNESIRELLAGWQGVQNEMF